LAMLKTLGSCTAKPTRTERTPGVMWNARTSAISRAGQNHKYTVYTRHFMQGFLQINGHIRRIYIRFWPTLQTHDGKVPLGWWRSASSTVHDTDTPCIHNQSQNSHPSL
jgi:hypothetical protein